jgi:hypothetical protein
MIVDRRECRSAGKTLTLAKWYMDSSRCIPEFLCGAEIDEKGSVLQIPKAHHNILWFDITVDVIM